MARYDAYRTIAREDKRARERSAARQEIDDAYDAYLAAQEAYDNAPADDYKAEWEAFKAAREHLYGLDPSHSVFTS